MGPRWARRPEEGSPQESAGVPANTREPARSGKKKPQPRMVGVLLLVVEKLHLKNQYLKAFREF